MSLHPDEALLNDYTDDVLSGDGRAHVAEHLDACAECRDAVARVRRLRATLSTLPLEIVPPPHVHEAVRARLAPRAGVAGEWRPAWYARPRALAAAALLLVALTAAATALVLRGPSPVPAPARAVAPAPPDGRPAALVAVQAMEQTYEDAIAELQRALDNQQSGLSPETLRVLEANLDVIDRAVAEARAALHADPANDALAALLRAGYERKLDVLRSVRSHGRARS
ncbi:MAG TPA: zf-HC2 domain-containing protein [Longimicrobiales bacterium]